MEIGEVCDRAEIRQLMDRYAVACDTGDWDAFRQLFTADCVLDYTEFGGGRATWRALSPGSAPACPATRACTTT